MALIIKTNKFAFRILLLSIFTRLTLSNPTLNHFYPYTEEGGMPLLKIHPGTSILLIGLLVLVATKNINKFLSDQVFGGQKNVLIGTFCLIVVIGFNTIRFGISNVAYLIDTYLYAYAVLLALTYLTNRQVISLARLFIIFLAANSIVAILEFAIQTPILPNSRQFEFFRAHALLGHPLNNALMTVIGGMFLLAMRLNLAIKIVVWMLFLLALLAFGARASTATFLISSLMYVIIQTLEGKGTLKQKLRKLLLGITALACATTASIFLIFHTNIGASISNRLTFDSSAMARVDSLVLFESISFNDLFWGIGSSGIEQAVFRYMTVDILENFWIAILLQFGIPSLLLLFLPFLLISFKFIKNTKKFGTIFVLTFLLTASTNNSLSVKTPILAMFMLILYAYHRMHTEAPSIRESTAGASRQ